MTHQFFQSTARWSIVQGEHLQDVQILIDDRSAVQLPARQVRTHGVKTLASWPIFVTAILNEQAEYTYAYALETSAELSLREARPQITSCPSST